jgi:hypothetical protein
MRDVQGLPEIDSQLAAWSMQKRVLAALPMWPHLAPAGLRSAPPATQHRRMLLL